MNAEMDISKNQWRSTGGKSGLSCWIHPAAQSTLGEQQWDLLVSEHCRFPDQKFQQKNQGRNPRHKILTLVVIFVVIEARPKKINRLNIGNLSLVFSTVACIIE